MTLTPKQEMFVLEYLLDFNATAAAERAGYTGKRTVIAKTASRLIQKADIQKALAVARAQRRERLTIDGDSVVMELARIAFARMTDIASWDDDEVTLFDSDSLPEDARAVVKEIRTTRTERTMRSGDIETTHKRTVIMHDKLGALDKLARYLGIYQDGLTIKWDQIDRADLAARMGVTESDVDAAIAEAERLTGSHQ
jgi:phage terminase small subunit